VRVADRSGPLDCLFQLADLPTQLSQIESEVATVACLLEGDQKSVFGGNQFRTVHG
jgi:hypothetical protein